MDTGTAIIGIIIIIVCVILVMIMHNHSKKKHNQWMKTLSDFAATTKGLLGTSDTWINGAIGLDENERTLFFVRKKQEEQQCKQIDLSTFKKAYIINESRSIGAKNELRTTDRLALVLSAGKEQPDMILEFYNVEYDSLRLMGEQEVIEKWNTIVNHAIQSLAQDKA